MTTIDQFATRQSKRTLQTYQYDPIGLVNGLSGMLSWLAKAEVQQMGQFFEELKRRNVLRVAIAYLAVSWLLIQIVETLFPVFGLSDALIRLIAILLIIGFPIILILSWVYELTPEGLKLERDVDRAVSIVHHTGKKLDRAIIVVLALALGYFAFDKFVLDPGRDVELQKEAKERGRTEALVGSFGDNSIAVLPSLNMSDDAGWVYDH